MHALILQFIRVLFLFVLRRRREDELRSVTQERQEMERELEERNFQLQQRVAQVRVPVLASSRAIQPAL